MNPLLTQESGGLRVARAAKESLIYGGGGAREWLAGPDRALAAGMGAGFGVLDPGSGHLARFWAGYRLGYPVATAVFRRVSMVMARARISRFAEAIATWSRFRFFASPR